METSKIDKLFAGNFPVHTGSVTLLASEGALLRGAVLGKVTKGAATIAAGTNTGNGVAGAVTRLVKALVGAYTLTCITAATNAGTFRVLDPNGNRLADLTIASAYNNGHFSVTIADGATDFIVGDSFTVTVAAGSGKYRLVNSANTDGSNIAEAVLAEDKTVGAADVTNVPIYETGDFNSAALTFGGTDTSTTHADTLKSKCIYCNTVSAQ